MKASFVLGVEENGGVRISARSLGEVNVQMIMEKIGGGGNLTMAGGQLKGSLRDAKIQLVEAIDEYMAAYGDRKKPPKSAQKQFRDTIRLPKMPSDMKNEENLIDVDAAEESAAAGPAGQTVPEKGKKKGKRNEGNAPGEEFGSGKTPLRGTPNIE